MSSFADNDSGTISAGRRLRDARERQGLTLDDAAGVTRISKTYLSAIEEERFEQLPSPAYARGFIRAYSKYLGLNEVEFAGCLREPPACAAAVTQDEPEPAAIRELSRKQIPDKRFWLLIPASAVCLAALYFFSGGGDFKPIDTDSRPVASAVPSTAVFPALSTAGKSGEGDAAAKPESRTDTPFETETAKEKGGILRLKALEDGPIDITIDDMASQHYELKAGDIVELKGEKVISLEMENGGGFEAQWNGKPMGPLGEKGVSAQVVLNVEETP
jgi:cytoskeleton protein RodZ